MRVIPMVKVVLLTGTIALISGFSGAASAAKMKLPPGACAFERKAVGNGFLCSYHCDPTKTWCSQQICVNGGFVQLINCFLPFCAPSCGG
jgi:hypothetical protein